MSSEIVVAIVGLVGIVIGAIPTYLFMRQRGLAEIEKLRAETDKTKAEADKIRSEIRASMSPAGDSSQQISGSATFLTVSSIDARASMRFGERLKTANSVDLVGYNLKSLLQNFRETLVDAVERGTSVRVVLVDITSTTGQLFSEHTRRPHLLLSEWVTAFEHLRDIQRFLEGKSKLYGKFEVRVTTWIPSCNIILVNANEEDGIAKLGINPLSFRQPLAGRPSLILPQRDYPKEFVFLVKSFDVLWNESSSVWDGSIPQSSTN